MGMPAFYVTALTALILAYADFQDWGMVAMLGIAFLAGSAIAFSAKKYSYWATLALVLSVVVSDAVGRSMGTTPNDMHSSVGLWDLSYSTFLVASVGWVGGYMMRGRESDPQQVPMLEPEPEAALATRRSPFAAPERRRRTA